MNKTAVSSYLAPDALQGRRGAIIEAAGSALAAAALVALIFSLAGIYASLGTVVTWLIFFTTIFGLVTWRLHGILATKDRLGNIFVFAGAGIAILPLGAIIIYVLDRGLPVVFRHFPHFLFADMSQGAGGAAPISSAGVAAAIIGSVEQVGIATAVAIPVAVAVATYFTESSSPFCRVVRSVVDAMTGTPSIIAGLFVYLFWVQPRHQEGVSGVAAAMALVIVMLPIMIRTAEEVLRVVPGSLREASIALGAPQWRVTMRVVLPTAKTGVTTAMILGIARGVGETAPVLFTAGGAAKINWNPFSGAQDDLPLLMKQLIFSPGRHGITEAWGAGLVLVTAVLLLFSMARVAGSLRPGQRLIPMPRRKMELSEEVALP